MKRPTVRELLTRIEELEAEVARLKSSPQMTAEDWIRVLRETQTPSLPPLPQVVPIAPFPPNPLDPWWGYPQIICSHGVAATHIQ